METNKIHNVDCLKFMETMDSNSVDLIVTDPPYGMNYQSSRRTDKHDKIGFDDPEDTNWVIPFLKESYRVLKDDSHIYIFCNDYLFGMFREWLEHCGFTVKRTLVWVKNNHTSGDLEGDYANKTEWIIFAHKGRRLLNDGRDTNVLNFNRESNTDDHPTPKPIDLLAFLIKKSSNEGDIVFDPFIGSGSTAIACKMLKRQYIGCEIDKKYFDIAEARINSISNTLF